MLGSMSRALRVPVGGLPAFPAIPVFLALVATIVVGGMVALERSAGAGVVVTAVTIDLVLVVPALHWLLLIRGRGLPLITLLPVFRLSLLAAGSVLPAGDRVLYDALALLARPAELGMGAYILHRLHRGWKAYRAAGTDDVLDRYRAGARAALPPSAPAVDRAADAIAFEAALVRYATGSWRAGPRSPPGALTFPGHRSSGYAGIVVGLLLVVAVEILVVHLLVAQWSHTVAWFLTALGVYGGVWLVGDLQAARLRPSWLDERSLCLRLGLRWTLTVPRHRVRAARKLGPGEAVPGALGLALPGSRRVLIELSEPAIALGVYGLRRTTTVVELGVDDPDRFVQAVRGQ
jgi:hypothetical protein